MIAMAWKMRSDETEMGGHSFTLYLIHTANIAVKNILFIIIANLHYLIPHAQHIAGNGSLRLMYARRINILLQKLI